jgi:hypothetical protein
MTPASTVAMGENTTGTSRPEKHGGFPNKTFGAASEKSCEIGDPKRLLVISPIFLDRPVKILARVPGLRPTFPGIRPVDKQETNFWGLD